MKSLYLRIYATVVLVLLLFALASGWVFQRHIEQERLRSDGLLTERMSAWAELIERSLPGADARRRRREPDSGRRAGPRLKNLYLRIYATVVVLLLLFAAASGWIFQRHMEQERVRAESVLTERMGTWSELIQRSLPGHDQPAADQAAALLEWSQRLRLPLALD
ncbi:MAG: hypothetical protein ABIP61_03785, partial [Burkholderiaceae bacterium]